MDKITDMCARCSQPIERHKGEWFSGAADLECPDGESLHVPAHYPLPSTRILSCGHTPTPDASPGTGYATWNATGETLCYACADARERFVIANGATLFYGYVSSLSRGAHVTTWTGGELATITDVSYDGTRYTPTGGRMAMVTVYARTPDGRRWSGRFNRHGGDLVAMRARKS
jgi:hypothetical protein